MAIGHYPAGILAIAGFVKPVSVVWFRVVALRGALDCIDPGSVLRGKRYALPAVFLDRWIDLQWNRFSDD